jgi:outer membrane receptor protein involved in Fe transport
MRKLIALSLFIVTAVYAHTQCLISGNLRDNNFEKVVFANIFIENNGQLIKGTVSDDNGYFCITDIAPGTYTLKISSVGYKNYEMIVVLKDKTQELTLPDVRLTIAANDLSELIVTADSRITEIKPSVIRYKTSSLISQNGGTAGDILKNMPSVAMGGSPGHNRDIRFRGLGNAYTKVLVNGRETGLSGNNRETVLDQIPAGSISYIEILSVPGAEYQSEGINGIVNIVLNENVDYGLHGKVDVFAGNFKTNGGGLSLSSKTEKLNAYVNYDYLYRALPKTKDKDKKDFVNDALSQMELSTETEYKSFMNQSLRGGLEYYFKPKTKILAEYNYGYQFEDKDKTLVSTKYTATGAFKSASSEVKTETKPNAYHQLNGGFEHYFKNNAHLTTNVSYQTESMKNHNEKAVTALKANGKPANFAPAFENNDESQKGERWLWNASLKKLKLGKFNTLSAGYAGEQESRLFNKATDKFNYKDSSWVRSNNGFDNFKVTETTHALFVSDELKIAFLRARAGLRYELTQTESNASTDTLAGKRTNGLLLPSLNLTANIDASQSITLNIGKRIRRPGFKDLNPFTEVKDAGNLKKGNPDLIPEKAMAYELGYLKNFKKFNVGANVFYRDIEDVIQNIKTSDENFIITEQPKNSGNAYVAGFELMSTIKASDFWQSTASFSMFDSKITSGDYSGDALSDQYKWSAKLVNDVNLLKGWSLQLAANVVGPKVTSTKIEETIWFADFGIEKKINENGRVYFRITDIFSTLGKRKSEITSNTNTTEFEKGEGLMFLAGVSWKF